MKAAPIDPSPPGSPDLETRVATRKRELIAEIVEHRKNPSRPAVAEALDRLTAQLAELARIVNAGVRNGWANVGPQARLELDEWIAR